ncbi:ABC-F family ATP-binding cassette domain-containing protein [Psychrobacter sp. I-STPA10]|uniref:ABC-F family ATP-binding cassette domain-containing protein n=1 Tax=Psychrobacter sp. I-STPA10 TaxID=2585769 RepID=UPI001E335D02|nr:ATP-binding cassette domain-containing protein [Psychrobacter sp. I-STPA10]
MIEFNNVGVRRDGRVLFTEATFQIHPGQKVGLTGNNGTGKSTLFAVLLHYKGIGDMSIDTGSVSLPSTWHIAHMAQEVAGSNQKAIDYVLSGDKEWFAINEQLAQSDTLSMEQITQLHQKFDDIDGYRTPARAAQVMSGLGFRTEQHELPVNDFSGGWRMRLNLAKTLMSRADLLLLDEPTNHLDLDAILWLEEWINKFDGTVLLISHDQAFLDATVGHILHIENTKLTLYTGNYSQFVRTRSERLSQQQQAFEKQQSTRAHLEDYIRRFRAKASKAKQAQSRIKQLERMAELSPVMADNPFSFEFYQPSHTSSPLIEMRQADIGYDGTALLHNVSLQITPDSCIGLLGMNGAGKSTLIKALVGDLPLVSGSYKVSDTLKIGYFNQHQMDSLDAEATPMLMLRRLAGKTSDAVLRAFLGSFDFRGDRIDTPSKLFSGGERARLTLALIVWQRPNVLVLDEPTNHLDLQMRQALTMALQGFAGAVVLVSHDRELIANVCDELYLVHAGKFIEFSGDVSDYGKWLSEQRKNVSATPQAADAVEKKSSTKSAPTAYRKNDANGADNKQATATEALSKEELRRRAAEQRKLTAPIRKRIEQSEKQLEKLTQQLEQLEMQLADTELYDDSRKAELLALLDEQAQLQQQQAQVEEEMLMAMTELEQMEAER